MKVDLTYVAWMFGQLATVNEIILESSLVTPSQAFLGVVYMSLFLLKKKKD